MKKKFFTWMLAVAAILTVASCSKPEERPEYIPDEEENEGGGTGREFYIFDCWSAYKGKPDDMSADKFSKCQLIYEAFLLDDNKELDMAKVKQQAQLAKMTGVRYISTDIEEWYSTKNGEALKDGLLQVFNEFKKAIPDCVIGNYGVPVSDLNVRRYAASQIGKPENEIQAGWISASEKRMPAAEVSDALFPSMYTHTDGSNADPITQYEKDVKTTADFLRQEFPDKKIYAYIWPQFYNLHMSPNDSYKQFMTAEQWTRVLEVCYANFDGVILWGNGSGPDDQPVAWSDSRMQTIYAATKSFVSKYYDDIAVAAGATGGDVEIVPTEFEMFTDDLGFTGEPRNLLKYGIQPINLIKESDLSEADKVDGVLPPDFDKIKHVAKHASLPVIFAQSTWINDRSTNNAAMIQRFADITEAFKSVNKDVVFGYRGVGPTALTELAAWNDYSTEFARKDSWLRYAVEPCRPLRQYADVICPVVTLINDDLDYWKSDCVSVFEEARLDNPGKKIYACMGTRYYGNPNKEGGFAEMFTPIKEEVLLQVLEYLYLRCDGIIFLDNATNDAKVAYSEDLGFMKAIAKFYANHKTVIDKTLPSTVADEDDIPPYVEEENEEEKVYRESITNGSFEDEIVPSFIQEDWGVHGEKYLVKIARLASYFDRTAQVTRPTAPAGTTVADGTWFHRCYNNSYFWHNYIDDTEKTYAGNGVPRAHTGTKSSAMYVADGAGENIYSAHKGNLQHLYGIGQTLSLNDKKTYTMKFWYYRPAKLWQNKDNNVQKIMAGIVSSTGATKETDYTYEQEFVLSKTDEWTECSITFNLPEIIKANPGKSFEKCAIFINIVPEIDPSNSNKTMRCLINIDDVSIEVAE